MFIWFNFMFEKSLKFAPPLCKISVYKSGGYWENALQPFRAARKTIQIRVKKYCSTFIFRIRQQLIPLSKAVGPVPGGKSRMRALPA